MATPGRQPGSSENMEPILGPGRAALRILGKASLALPTLYVLGYIYIKTYLAHFRIDVDLASLSIVNLLLAHRYLAGLDFFVIAGALQVYLFSEIPARGTKQRPRGIELFSALILLTGPILIATVAALLAGWSEAGVPNGFNPRNYSQYLAMLLVWVGTVVVSLCVRYLLRSRRWSYSYGAAIIGCAILVGCTVAGYRLFGKQFAKDRAERSDFERVLVTAGGNANTSLQFANSSEKCDLLYADSQSFFLKCGERVGVLRRDDVLSIEISR